MDFFVFNSIFCELPYIYLIWESDALSNVWPTLAVHTTSHLLSYAVENRLASLANVLI